MKKVTYDDVQINEYYKLDNGFLLVILDENKNITEETEKQIAHYVNHAFNYLFRTCCLGETCIRYDKVEFHDKENQYLFNFVEKVVTVLLLKK